MTVGNTTQYMELKTSLKIPYVHFQLCSLWRCWWSVRLQWLWRERCGDSINRSGWVALAHKKMRWWV